MLKTRFMGNKMKIFLAIALLLCVALLYQFRAERLRQTAHISATPARVGIASAETPRTNLSPMPAEQFSFSTVAYVPVRGFLRERKLSPVVEGAQVCAHGDRTPLLNEVIRLAPNYFPPHAHVIAVEQDEGQTSDFFLINLNRSFSNVDFWRGRKRRDTILALHSLARNVAFQHDGKGIPLPVQFVIEGKRVAKIGAFAASQLLPADKIIDAP